MTDQITVLDPPPFVEKFDYKPLKQINDPVTRKRVYLTPDGEKLPSVTTILGATKDMTHLNLWKKRVGEAKAQQKGIMQETNSHRPRCAKIFIGQM